MSFRRCVRLVPQVHEYYIRPLLNIRPHSQISSFSFPERLDSSTFASEGEECIETNLPLQHQQHQQQHEQAKWIHVLDTVVHVDVGSLNEKSWNTGLAALFHWSRTPDDMHRCFQILDRLVIEEGKACTGELTTDHLNDVICIWANFLDCTLTARDILQKLEAYRIQAPELYPDTNTYVAILEAAIAREEKDAHLLAEELIGELIQNERRNPFVPPNSTLFTAAILAVAKGRIEDAPQRAEALFQKMTDMTLQGVPGVSPNQKTYNAMLQAWCFRADLPEAPSRAEELLMEMPIANTTNFAKVLKLWGKSKVPGSTDRMLSVFARMKDMYKAGNELVKPHGYIYGEILRGLSYVGRARQAETILKELVDVYEETDDPTLAPKQEYFTSLIYAWSKSGESDAPQRAENILQLMQDMAKRYESIDMQPDATSFNCVIHAYAKCDNHEAYRRAYFILQRMWDLHEGGMPNVKPNNYTYMFVLDALINSRQRDAAIKATSLLRAMHARRLTGDNDIIPTTLLYNTVLEAWAKSGLPQAPEEIELLLSEMETMSDKLNFPTAPNIYSYNLLCRAWERSGRKESMQQCQQIFSKLKRLERSGRSDLLPNSMTYQLLLESCSHNADMAQSLLETMCRDFINGDSDVKPTVGSFNTVINVWIQRRDKDSISRAEDIFRKMKDFQEDLDIKPDTTTFNTLMFAWSVAVDKDYVLMMRKINEYQEEMMALFEGGDTSCTPSGTTFNPKLRVLLHSQDPDALEQSISLLDDLKANQKLPGLPDKSNYFLVMKILRGHPIKDKAQKSWDILQEMIERGLTPSDRHFDMTINACARAGVYDQETHEKAFDVALATLRLMLESTKPTSETFVHFFHTAAGLDRHDEVDEVYRLCCNHECHKDDAVRSAFRRATSSHLLSKARSDEPSHYNGRGA